MQTAPRRTAKRPTPAFGRTLSSIWLGAAARCTESAKVVSNPSRRHHVFSASRAKASSSPSKAGVGEARLGYSVGRHHHMPTHAWPARRLNDVCTRRDRDVIPVKARLPGNNGRRGHHRSGMQDADCGANKWRYRWSRAAFHNSRDRPSSRRGHAAGRCHRLPLMMAARRARPRKDPQSPRRHPPVQQRCRCSCS